MIEEKPDKLDNLFREELENLPEEKPSAGDWQQMSYRLQSEGLNSNGHSSNGKKYFLLVLLFTLLSGIVSLPFLLQNNNQGGRKEITTPLVKIEKNSTDKNSLNPTAHTASAEKAMTNFKDASTNESSAQSLTGQQTVSSPSVSAENYADRQQSGNLSAEKQNNMLPPPEITASNDKDVNGNDSKNDAGEGINAADKNIAPAVVASSASPQPSQNPGSDSGNPPVPGLQVTDANPVAASASPALSNDTAAAKTDSITPTIDFGAQKSSGPKRFRIGFYVSLDYNYYTLKKNSNVYTAESDFVSQSDMIKGEKWNGQYTIGVMGGYLFTEKWSLEAGAFYSQKKKLHAEINTPAYSESDAEMFSDFTYDYSGRYFEMYGRAKYYFKQRQKFSLYATLGAAGSFNLPVSNSDYFLRTSYGESKTADEHVALDASSASLLMVLSAGVEIPLGTSWDVYVEPAYKYSFNPVIKQPDYDRVPVQHFLRSVSMATGLMYKF